MASRVSFSGEHLGLPEIVAHRQDLESALTLYYGTGSPSYSVRFGTYRPTEVTGERRNEADLSSSLTVLASVEAAFRIDYLQRCYRRGKDPVSRAFRDIYKAKRQHASLEDEIFEVGSAILLFHAQSLANCVAHLGSATGWRMDATGHPDWDGASTLTTSSHLPI